MATFDLASLPVISEENVMKHLSARVAQEIYFTLVGPVLLSVRHKVDSESQFKQYLEQDFSNESTLLDPAHLYLYLMKIYNRVLQQQTSQSVIICGLRTSGKSSIFSDCVRFLSAADIDLSQQLHNCVTVLQTFNSTITPTNTWSSRSSMQVNMYFDDSGKCCGAEFNQYGIELGRVALLAKEKTDRNFNLFYFLLYGESEEELETFSLRLKEHENNPYLPPIKIESEPEKNVSSFCAKGITKFKQALQSITGDDSAKKWIFTMLSVILHLGRLQFTQLNAKKQVSGKVKEKLRVKIQNLEVLETIKNLLEWESIDQFKKQLVSGKTVENAQKKRDTFAMILYSLISKFLLTKVNEKVKTKTLQKTSITIIDIIGVCNSSGNLGLEEFFINYSNEKLRQVFYQNELESTPVEFQDNQTCVEISEDICKLFEEENITLSSILTQVEQLCETNNCVSLSNSMMTLQHYSGEVSYNLEDWFPVLNQSNTSSISTLVNITLSAGLIQREIEPSSVEQVPDQISGTNFLNRITTLIDHFKSTSMNFVYCLHRQENETKLNIETILPQLKSHGIIELAEVLQYTIKPERILEYCNTFPGGSGAKKRKKRNDKLTKLFSDRFGSSKAPEKPLESSEVRRLQADAARDKRRSRSFKERILYKSRKDDSSSSSSQNLSLLAPSKKEHSFMHSSSSLSTRALKLDYKYIQSAHSTVDNRYAPQNSSDSDSSDSLILSEDEIFKVTSDDNELDSLSEKPAIHFLHLLPCKKILENPSIFATRLQKLNQSSSQDRDYFFERIENFSWRDLSTDKKGVLHLVDNIDLLHELTRRKIMETTDSIPTELTEKECKSRRQQFLEIYKCGSLLRTVHQRTDSALPQLGGNGPLTFKRHKGLIETGGLQRSSSDGNISRISKNELPKRNRIIQTGFISPRYSSEEDTDEEEGEGDADADDEVSWTENLFPDKPARARASLTVHLSMDTLDDTINQINFSNTIRPSPRKRKAMIDFTNATHTYSFVTYAQTNFRVSKKITKLKPGSSKYKAKFKKLTSATRQPITSSLLRIKSSALVEIAVQNFKHILAYMMSKSDLESNTLESDGKPFYHATQITRKGLEKSSLRDEIYCQLIKQATNNLKERFLIRIWELLAFCCGCFPPSDYFHKYLIKFLDTTAEETVGEIGAWASFCKDRLLKITEIGKRFFVPTEREFAAVQQRKPLMQEFYFMDARQKKVPIYSSTTAMEALEFLLQMIGLKDPEGYMVYEHYVVYDRANKTTEVIERSLLYSEVLCNSLSKFEELEQVYPADKYQMETSFLIKRKLFLNPRKMPTDPVEIILRFYQAIVDIRSGCLLVREHDALLLCALELQADFGDFSPTINKNIKEMVPENIRNLHSKAYWTKEILDRHKQLVGIAKEEAKKMYLQFCTQLPFYGFHIFPVKHSSSWKMPLDIYIGIHIRGIFFLSGGKEVYYSFPFIQILSQSSTPFTLQITFDNGHSIELRTNKGDEIISLIIDYKYYEYHSAEEKKN